MAAARGVLEACVAEQRVAESVVALTRGTSVADSSSASVASALARSSNKRPRARSLCGCEKLLFEPPVFYCNGLSCRSKRIRRNSYFYVGGNNQYHWCQPCYDDLKESKPIQMPDLTLKKSSLDKKKNNEVPEESWVQCDRCERWIHQICALFNTRQNKDQRSEFVCASCTVVERKEKNAPEPTSTTPMAEDLPRTKLSEHLEKHLRAKLQEKEESEAKAKMAENEVSFTFVLFFCLFSPVVVVF